MTPPSNHPTPEDTFDALAEGYDELGDSKPHNAHLERPAILSLLPDVHGARVLDAGCGAGHLTEALDDRGATVVGIDVSQEMLTYARERVPDAEFSQVDLADGIPFPDDSFDGIASSLAFHYVSDWGTLFGELRRILRPGGWIVCSVQHPHADFEEYEDSENYHETEQVSVVDDSFGEEVEVGIYRRPLSAMTDPILDAGFTIDRFLEPVPTEEFRQQNPDRYEYEATHPNFLCLRLLAPE